MDFKRGQYGLQPAFITDKLPHQSVSVGNDPETVSRDSSCIAECCMVTDLINDE